VYRCSHLLPNLCTWSELDSSTRFSFVVLSCEDIAYEVWGFRYVLECTKTVPHNLSTTSKLVADGGANKA